jgi:hypothetical protein
LSSAEKNEYLRWYMSDNVDLTFLPGSRKRPDYQCLALKAHGFGLRSIAGICIHSRFHFDLDRQSDSDKKEKEILWR